MITDTEVVRALEAWVVSIAGVDEGMFPIHAVKPDPYHPAMAYDVARLDNERWPPIFELAVGRPIEPTAFDPAESALTIPEADYNLLEPADLVHLSEVGGITGLEANELRYLIKLDGNKIAFAADHGNAEAGAEITLGGALERVDSDRDSPTFGQLIRPRVDVSKRGTIIWQTATFGPVAIDYEGLHEAYAEVGRGQPNPQRPRLETAFVPIETQQLGLKAGGTNRRRWLFQVTAVAGAPELDDLYKMNAQYMCLALLEPVIRRFEAGAVLIDNADGRVYVRKRTHLGPALTIESEYRVPATVHLQAFAP